MSNNSVKIGGGINQVKPRNSTFANPSSAPVSAAKTKIMSLSGKAKSSGSK